MVWKTIINLGIVFILIAQPVNAHRKYWENTDPDTADVASDDLNDDDIPSESTSEKKKNISKKVLSLPQSNSETSQKSNSETPQMPTAMKGVGIPGSPHQKEVLPKPVPKDSLSSKAEDLNTSHGHLIHIPRTSSGENP